MRMCVRTCTYLYEGVLRLSGVWAELSRKDDALLKGSHISSAPSLTFTYLLI